MIRQQKYVWVIFGFVSLLWFSCKQERPVCFEPLAAPLRVGFYQTIETDTGFVVADSALPNALIFALDTPRVLVNASEPGTEFWLYLSPSRDSTRFMVLADSMQITDPEQYDTVTFYHETQLQFVSVACGYTNFFRLKDLRSTRHNIDSASILNAEVTNAANTQHVKVYY